MSGRGNIEMVKFSIIIPVYKVEKYIERCIRSVKEQTYNNLEVLIVNDGSPDSSIKITEDIIGNDRRFKILNKANGGLGDARNYGVKYATGDYLAFIDSDDFIDSDLFEKAEKLIRENNYDVIVFDFVRYFSEKRQFIKKSGFVEGDIYSTIRTVPNACNKIIRTELWKENNLSFPVGLWYEDVAVIPAVVSYANKSGYLQDSYYYYQSREGSITNTKKYSDKVMDILKSFDFLLSKVNDSFENVEMEYLMVAHIIYLGTQRVVAYNKKKEFDEMLNYVEAKYPKWDQNPLISNLSFVKRVYLWFAGKRVISICKGLVLFREKIMRV